MKNFNQLLLCITLIGAMFVTGCKKDSCKTNCGPKKQSTTKVVPKDKKAKKVVTKAKKVSKKNSKCKTKPCKKGKKVAVKKAENKVAQTMPILEEI